VTTTHAGSVFTPPPPRGRWYRAKAYEAAGQRPTPAARHVAKTCSRFQPTRGIGRVIGDPRTNPVRALLSSPTRSGLVQKVGRLNRLTTPPGPAGHHRDQPGREMTEVIAAQPWSLPNDGPCCGQPEGAVHFLPVPQPPMRPNAPDGPGTSGRHRHAVHQTADELARTCTGRVQGPNVDGGTGVVTPSGPLGSVSSPRAARGAAC